LSLPRTTEAIALIVRSGVDGLGIFLRSPGRPT